MMAARRSAVARVGMPTVMVAVLATAVMVAVNYATAEATTGPWAWAIVGVVTLLSAAASFWLYHRTRDTPPADAGGTKTPNPGAGANVTISGNAFQGPAGVQGSGVQNNRFGS